MDMMAEETRLPADTDAQPMVQAAAALKPVLRDYHDEIEREQRMPSALFEQLWRLDDLKSIRELRLTGHGAHA